MNQLTDTTPNDSAHRHGGGDTTPAERAANLQQATEEFHEAVFGAASCSSPCAENAVIAEAALLEASPEISDPLFQNPSTPVNAPELWSPSSVLLHVLLLDPEAFLFVARKHPEMDLIMLRDRWIRAGRPDPKIPQEHPLFPSLLHFLDQREAEAVHRRDQSEGLQDSSVIAGDVVVGKNDSDHEQMKSEPRKTKNHE